MWCLNIFGKRVTEIIFLIPTAYGDQTSTRLSRWDHSSVTQCDSLWPHGLQHARLPCPSPNPRDCSNSCPSRWWCHPTILSSVVPFSYPESFSASGSFPMSRLFPSGGQNIGASASVLPINIQDLFPLGFTGWISLQSKGLSRVFLNTLKKHQFFSAQRSLWSRYHKEFMGKVWKDVANGRIDAFKLWGWRRLLRVPWNVRRSQQSILEKINPEYYWKDFC